MSKIRHIIRGDWLISRLSTDRKWSLKQSLWTAWLSLEPQHTASLQRQGEGFLSFLSSSQNFLLLQVFKAISPITSADHSFKKKRFYVLNVCGIPLKFLCWSPIPHWWPHKDGAFGQIRFTWDHEGRALKIGFGPLIRKDTRAYMFFLSLSLPLSTPHVRRKQEVDHLQVRKSSHQKPIMLAPFQHLKLWGNKFLFCGILLW